MLGNSKRCCVCIDLKTGSFIIAYVLLLERFLTLLLSCFHLSGINTSLSNYHHFMHNDLEVLKLVLSLDILLLTFELLITFALINGLHKSIQDQVQMFYVGGFVFFVLRIFMVTLLMMRYAHHMALKYGALDWLLVGVEILGKLLYIYFLSVIRRYYFRLRTEADTQRSNVFSNSQIQLTIDKGGR